MFQSVSFLSILAAAHLFLTTGSIALAQNASRVLKTATTCPNQFQPIDQSRMPSALRNRIEHDGAHAIYHEFRSGEFRTAWIIGVDRAADRNGPFRITSAYFKRETDAEFLRILGPSGLSDVFMAYSDKHPSGVLRWDWGYIGKQNQLQHDQLGMCEMFLNADRTIALGIADSGILWHRNTGKRTSRGSRASSVVIWSAFNAENYDYISRVRFHSDGRVTFEAGATAQNLGNYEKVAHLHIPVWKIDIDLGDDDNAALLMSYDLPKTSLQGRKKLQTLGAGGLNWTNMRFPSILVMKQPPSKLAAAYESPSYEIIPNARSFIGTDQAIAEWALTDNVFFGDCGTNPKDDNFVKRDVWLSIGEKDSLSTRTAKANWCPRYVPFHAEKRAQAKGDVVIWLSTPILHVPRTEDGFCTGIETELGCQHPENQLLSAWNGVALAMFAGVTLKPRNIFERTPFYQRD